ncbi:unnamed protein product [Brachionus calyciflorus]|uniref:Uncharacterized protein n=1 Tax=Brachionus calyciflorus TaxID=104777 RepID=A0A814GWJ4_9BILA|nr:unnamed protein product [Brachionus calyciflorus]
MLKHLTDLVPSVRVDEVNEQVKEIIEKTDTYKSWCIICEKDNHETANCFKDVILAKESDFNILFMIGCRLQGEKQLILARS